MPDSLVICYSVLCTATGCIASLLYQSNTRLLVLSLGSTQKDMRPSLGGESRNSGLGAQHAFVITAINRHIDLSHTLTASASVQLSTCILQ